MKNLLKHPALITTVVIVAILAVGTYSYISLTQSPHYDYASPVVKNITENISVTGQVKAVDDLSLAFQTPGKVARDYVAVGDKVVQGESLVSLDAVDALNDLASAKAALALAQAQAGIQGTESSNAESALNQAQTSLLDKIQNAYIVSDDAVRTQASQFFTNASSPVPQLQVISQDQQLMTAIQDERLALEQTLTNWNQEVNLATSSNPANNFDVLSAHARQNVLAVKQFLDNCAINLNNSIVTPAIPSATLAAWKLAISTARANVSGALSALTAADSQLTSAESADKLAEQQVQAGANLSVSQAQVDQAQVAVDRANSALSKTVLRAPFDGVVTSVDAKVGQTVSVGAPAVGLISNSNYQIEGYVSEADAAKIHNGQTGNVTLDAYGDSVLFPVKVVLVDPAETIQNGVSSYKVTFEFINNDERIKSGMTANVSIFVDSRNNVLTVPQSAIVRRGTDEYVLTASGKSSTVLTKVVTGLEGDDGSVEILSGLNASSSIVSLNGAAN